MGSKRIPAAPTGVGSRGKRLWKALHQSFSFSPDELELLSLAVECVDRAEKAQVILMREGVTSIDRFGQVKEHAAVTVRNSAETNAAKLLRQLGLRAEVERAIKNGNIRSGVIKAHRAKG
jgi:phage terminase small subunit